MEAGNPGVSSDIKDRARAALEAAGVIFVEENGEGPGVRLGEERPILMTPKLSMESRTIRGPCLSHLRTSTICPEKESTSRIQ